MSREMTMTFSWHFIDWCTEVDRLCRAHLACSWAELAGDPEPLVRAFHDKETPEEFVQWVHEKYDLDWLTPLEAERVSQ